MYAFVCLIVIFPLVIFPSLDVSIPKAASKKIIDGVECDEFGAKDYRPQLQLRPDHDARPLWVVCFIIYDRHML